MMLKNLIKTWTLPYVITAAIFFIFFRQEPIHPQLSALNYARRLEVAILSRIRANEQPSAYELRQGIEYYKKLINVLGPMGHAYSNQGFCYYYLGDLDKALKMYEKAAELNPWDYWNYWDQAVIYWDRQDYEKASAFFRKAIDTVGETLQFYGDFAQNEDFRASVGEQVVQSDFLFLVVRAQKDQALALEKLGEIFLRSGEKKASEAMLEAARSITSRQQREHAVVGEAYGLAALARNPYGKPQLHFNATCFATFFVNLAAMQKIQK